MIVQFCFTRVRSQNNYEYTIRGKRLEGTERRGAISAPDLELISFLAYKEPLKVGSNANVKIRFFLEKDTSLYITAKELNVIKKYKMKPLQNIWSRGWHEFNPWPTDDVLHPLGLSLDEIGIVGRIGLNRIGSGKIAPLLVYSSNCPDRIAKYELHFIAKRDLKKVKYALYECNGDAAAVRGAEKRIRGNVPFPIVIDCSQVGEGSYRLVLDCKYKNRKGGPIRTYIFYHKPVK